MTGDLRVALVMCTLAAVGCNQDKMKGLQSELAAKAQALDEANARIAALTDEVNKLKAAPRPAAAPAAPVQPPFKPRSNLGKVALVVLEKLAGASSFQLGGSMTESISMAFMRTGGVDVVQMAPDAKAVKAMKGGTVDGATARAVAKKTGARHVLILKVTGEDNGPVMGAGLRSIGMRISGQLLQATGVVAKSEEKAAVVPCVGANLAPASCRSLYERRGLLPLLRGVLGE